jgi:hypothetical protein
MWNVACVYANDKAPKDIAATFQSLVDGIHWGLGSGLGSLLGGYYYEVYGAVDLFQSCKIITN